MITKKLSPKGKSLRLTFELPAEAAAESVAVAGDFNEWDVEKHPMKFDTKKGVWSKAISVKPGRAYEFRYFVDGANWVNDEAAEALVATPYFSENGVIYA